MIKVRRLSKSFNVPAGKYFVFPRWKSVEVLHGISFGISRGEFVGLVGPNGAGKTTTMKILSGILTPSSGEVILSGYNPQKRRSDFFKSIGVMFGNRSNLVFDIPVIDSFLLLKDIYGVPEKTFSRNLSLFTSMLDLDPLLQIPVRKLSFGQRMRAETAAVFLHSPKAVLLDEPTIALDAVAKQSIYNFLRTINEKTKTTIILTTHNLSEIELLCNRMILIHKGNLMYDGSIQKFRDEYVDYKHITFEILQKVGRRDVMQKYRLSRKGNIASGRIKRSDQIKAISDILSTYKLSSLSVSDPSLEEILSEYYRAM